MRIFGPRNPLFLKVGIRGLSAVRGIPSLGGENPGAFPKAGPIFQQPFPLPVNAQTLAGLAFGAAGKSVKNFPAASKFARKFFHKAISDSDSLLKFSEFRACLRVNDQGCQNGRFGKRCFCPLPKTVVSTKIGETSDIAF